MKKVLIINSSPNKEKGKTEIIISAVEKGLTQSETKKVSLSDYKIQKCIKTDSCKITKSHNYFKEKNIIELLTALSNADIVIFGTPLYQTGMTIDLQVLLELYSHKKTDLINQEKISNFKIKENQKWIIISTCLYPEIKNFYVLNNQFETFSNTCGSEIILKIYRPLSDLLEMNKESPYIKDFLNQCTYTTQTFESEEKISTIELQKLYKEVILDIPEIIY